MATRAASNNKETKASFSSGAKRGYERNPQKPVDTSKIDTKEGEAGDFDYDTVIAKADNSDNPDGYKYQVAVQLAKDKAGEDVDDNEMRDLVDAEFAKLNPDATGAMMRGEDNLGAEIMGGFDKARNAVSDAVGSGIDAIWDGVVGNAAGLIGGAAGWLAGDDSWGQAADDFVSGMVGDEDGAFLDTRTIGDIATSLALTAIPGVGVPLSAGLAVLDNADNIREAVDGRDSITREKLDGGERGTKLASAALDTALAAAPGIGKLRNASAADDILAVNGDDILQAAVDAGDPKNLEVAAELLGGPKAGLARELSPQAMGRAAKQGGEEAVARLKNVPEAVENSSGPINAIGNVMHAVRTPTTKGMERQLVQDIIGGVGRRDGAKLSGDALNEAVDKAAAKSLTAGKNLEKGFGRRMMHNILPEGKTSALNNFIGSGGMAAAAIPTSMLGYAAETNQDLVGAMDDLKEAVGASIDEDGGIDVGSLMPILAPVGANIIAGANRRPGVSGRLSKVNPSLRYTQLGAAQDLGRYNGERDHGDYAGNETLSNWLSSVTNDEEDEE